MNSLSTILEYTDREIDSLQIRLQTAFKMRNEAEDEGSSLGVSTYSGAIHGYETGIQALKIMRARIEGEISRLN